ncbi:uncharacterized protein I206_104629 [Kwoniella pini CBS 10737]|uniref:Uncharacterized protein n=1 Tax=Kwoniella pini CBS 10737 TaxID=1296096 RepID=A0A1B9I7C1_9TREE|nr:uncharacterized protein I206_02164 [Kwoniella pini CBS 10737]OCF51450.1 hypothetical protein I206_02164 [Kwoniella pini CBS 10737]
MCCGRRNAKIDHPPANVDPPPPVHQYDYGDMPSPALPPGYTFDPYNSSLKPDEVYLVGKFLSQIVNASTRPQSRNPFIPMLIISSLIFPEWVPDQIRLGVHFALPPDLLKNDGVPLILQCPVEFAEQLRERQIQEPNPAERDILYFGWGPMRHPTSSGW